MESASGATIDLHAPERRNSKAKPGRFLRQRLTQQPQGPPRAESHFNNASISWEQRQRHVLHAFSGLGVMASKLSVVLAQPEMDCEELRSMGFMAVRTSTQAVDSTNMATECPPGVSGVVIVNYGTDFRVALDCCSTFDQFTNAPPSIAVLVLPGEEPAEFREQDMHFVKKFLETGADDVMTLYGSETITGLRVQEAILRTEIMARKASAMINQEVDAVKKKAARTLQVAWKRFMWDLPGKVLENIPFKDDTVKEHTDTEQSVGVGDYAFTGQLGAGTFGAVFKAEHPKLGTCALKVIAKSSVKNVCQLLSIDSELCIMTNLSAHPHVAKAQGALHNEANIVLVMDYCGDLNLHSFLVRTLKSSGEATLPPALAERFCRQEAAGVAHLHAFMVCHRDLKPTNFIVSNDGTTLRLTDFGLAVMACGPNQKLLHCCGSLPFAAPEVLRLQHERKAIATGYNGFAADIWSLAVNFVELGYGLYSMERLLGWVPQPPAEAQQRLLDIEHFMDVWATVPEMSATGLKRVVDMMFALQPEERWTIGQVIGSEGLSLEEVHAYALPGCLRNLKLPQAFDFVTDDAGIGHTPSPVTPSKMGRPQHLGQSHREILYAPDADESAFPVEG